MCDCQAVVEKELNKKNTTFDTLCMVNMASGKMRSALQISTSRLAPGKSKIIRVAVTFCPFCGTKLVE